MDQEQNEEDHVSRWDSPSPVERKSQKQSPSEKAVDHNTSTESHSAKLSHLKQLLTRFGLSVDDLKKLSQYPDDQLTPENMPVLLQAIRTSKLASKAPTFPSKSTEKETVSRADGSGPTVQKKVIDYGHKSKYGYNEGPVEVKASSTATDESVKGFQTQEPASVPAAASSLISNPKNLTTELIQPAGSPASTPNCQASPLVNPAQKVPLAELGIPATVPPVRPPPVAPVPQAVRHPATPPLLSPAVNQPSFVPELMELLRRHERSEHTRRADPPNRPCQTMAGQRSLWKEAEEPFKSPFGVVKASWLPDFSPTEKQKGKKLPTSPQMCDYYAVTPRIFPHTCSLCNEDCIDKKDWLQHQNTFLHNENCRQLLHQYPNWAPENPCSPKRHEGDRQERHESRQHSASPSPKRSRLSSSGYARHWTRSRSRSSGRHRASRPRSRSPSRRSASPSPKHSRCSGSGYARHRTRSRSRSSERHRTGRPRSRSPSRHSASPCPKLLRCSGYARHRTRSRSRSSERRRTSRPRSRSPRRLPSPRHRSRSRSRSPRQSLHSSRWSQSSSSRERRRWSRSRSSERHRTSRPRSRSPRHPPSPRHHSRSPRQSSHSNKLSQNSSSKERISGSSTKSTEGRHAKTPCSKKEYSEQKWTCSGPDCQKKRGEDLEQTREDAPHQKLSADERRSKEQTCDKLVPEGRSRVEPEHSALASLTEKSVLQAMAQLQAQGAAGGTLSEGRNSAQLAARLTNTSAASSDLISMIQQVATQVITAVLDSRGASTTRASRRDPNRHRVKSVTKKAKSQSLGDPSTQQGTAKGTKGPSTQHGTAKGSKDPSTKQGTTKGTKGPSTKHGTTKSAKGLSTHKGSAKDTKGPRTQQGTAKNAKGLSPHKGSAKDTKGPRTQQGTAKGTKGPSPHKGSAKDTKGLSTQQGTAKGTKGPSPQQGTDKNTKGPSPHKGSAKDTKSPSTQQGTAKDTKGPSPHKGSAKDTKSPSTQQGTAKDTKGPSPQQGTVEGTKGPSSQQASADGTKGPSPQEGSADGIKGPSSQQGTDKDTKGPSPQQGTAKSTEAKRTSPESPCPKEDTSLCSQAKSKCVVSPSVQQGTAASDEEETMSVVDQWPEPVIAPSDKAADDRVLGLSPHQGTAVGSKSESQGVAASCGLKEGAAGSSETESLPVADPVPKQGTSASGETENKCPEVPSSQQDIGPNIKARQGDTEPVLVPGSVCPGSEAPTGLASVSWNIATREVKAVSSTEEASRMQTSTGEAAVSSQPVSSKAENSGVASPSLPPGTSGPCKTMNQDVEQKLVLGNVPPCPGSFGHSSDSPRSSPKPRVWICGDSMVISAQKRASSTAAGSQLGLEQSAVLEWHGQEELTWIQLLPFVQNLVTWCEAPDALIIHFGGEDLVRAYDRGLTSRMKTEWSLLRTLFPGVRVIWSEVIPPVVQRGQGDFKRRLMNTLMGKAIKIQRGNVVKHPKIVSENPKLYLDEANLSPAGLDIFLEDIRNGILAHLCQSRRATGGGRLQEGRSLPPPASPAAPAGLDSVSHQEAATREDEAVSSTEEASSTRTSTGEAAGSSQPVNRKAENFGVVSPSPQPGTSGTHKAEIKDVEPKLVFGNIPHCSGSPEQPSKPRVWICGHSLIDIAQERAATTSIGSQLGLEEEIVLEWHGWDGMMWVQLIPFLQDLATYHWPPDVLIIHVGENDLMYTPSVSFLIKIIHREFFLVKELFPKVKVVWSEMMPGLLPCAADKDESLKKVNLGVAQYVRGHGGAVIKHPGLSSEHPYTNQARLSDVFLDIFLKDIKEGILAHLRQPSRAAGAWLDKATRLPPPVSPATPTGLASTSRRTAAREDNAVLPTKEASSVWRTTGGAAVCSQPVSSKARKSGVASPSPQTGMSGICKAMNCGMKQSLVLRSLPPWPVCLPGEAAVSSQPVSKKAETSDVASPSPPPGTSGPCKAENEDAEQELVVSIPLSLVCLPGEAAVSSQPVSKKAETSDVASPSPQPGTPGPCKAENKDVELGAGSVPPCPGEAAVSSQPVSIKAETSNVASPGPQPGTSGPCKAENKDVEQELVLGSVPPCPGEAAVSSQPVTIKAETSDVASPSPQQGTSGPCKAENKDVEQELVAGSIPPCPGEAAVSSQPVTFKAETSDVAGPSPQAGTSGPCKAENKDVEQELVAGSIPPCPGEAAGSSQPVSIKAETSDVASPGPQPGTSGPCKAENKDVEQELVLGSVPPCPGEPAVSSQPVSIKVETSDVASPSPLLGTPGPCNAENEDVKQELALGSVPPCPGEAAGSSQPVSIKVETSDVDSPSPQPGTSEPCKAENKDAEQELLLGSVPPCPEEAAVSSQPVNIKAETSDVASPSPPPKTPGSCKAENEVVEQKLVAGSIPPCPGEAAVSSQPVSIKAETSDVASPSPPPGTSGPCKAENKDVEQELALENVPPCPGNPERASKRRVWICGQSVVVSAEKQASGTGAGSQLGLEEGVILEWHGQEGLTWTQLVPLLQSLAAQGQAPDVLIVHLGESDLEGHRGAPLASTIRKELELVKELFPQVRILWSNLLLRRRGSGKAGSRTVNRARTVVNLEMGPFVATLGGAVIEHQAILHTDPDFYTDGDNLSGRGLDLFLEDVKNGILAHLQS